MQADLKKLHNFQWTFILRELFTSCKRFTNLSYFCCSVSSDWTGVTSGWVKAVSDWVKIASGWIDVGFDSAGIVSDWVEVTSDWVDVVSGWVEIGIVFTSWVISCFCSVSFGIQLEFDLNFFHQ